MNTRPLVKLFITLLVLVGAQIVSKTPEASQNVVPQVVDGSSCIPWTPTTCFPPGAMQQELADGGSCIPWTPTTCMPGIVQQPLATKPKMEVADGTQCIPWTPTSCMPGVVPLVGPKKELEVADGTQCIPWTPDTCRPMKAREQG